jgi:hypothetical protein
MMFEGSRQDKNQAAKQNDKTDLILPAAFEHHQQQKSLPEPVAVSSGDTR